jgi:hypothetical protein
MTDAQRQGVKAVRMDMWEPFAQATATELLEGAEDRT